MNPSWPGRIFFLAAIMENQPARSTSGNSACFPDLGGHSMTKVLLAIAPGSQSPWNAQALISLPLGCLRGSSWMKVSAIASKPVSSWNSRLAAANASSCSAYSPLGMDQAPSSFFVQNGPPGWTRKISSSASRKRNIIKPALFLPAIRFRRGCKLSGISRPKVGGSGQGAVFSWPWRPRPRDCRSLHCRRIAQFQNSEGKIPRCQIITK